MTDSTDEPTRPLPERDERVIATLPGCPELCDQKHRNLEYDGGLVHEKWIGVARSPARSSVRRTASWSRSLPTRASAA